MALGLFDDTQTVRRGFRKVIIIALLATLLSAILLSLANDVYAVFKPDTAVHVSFNEPCSLSDFSRTLEQHGILFHPYLFSLYVKSRDRVSVVEAFYGDLSLNTSMSYREILRVLSDYTPSTTTFSTAFE